MTDCTRECTVTDCANRIHARGYCKKHYQRWQSTGDATRTLSGWGRNRERLNLKCSVARCTGERKARGFCNRHYKRWKATGDPESTPSGMKHEKPEVCSVVGCADAPRTRGYCAKHYARVLKWGDATHPVREHVGNRGRVDCARCGSLLVLGPRGRKCEKCDRINRVAKEGKRRASMRTHVCSESAPCTRAQRIFDLMSRSCVYCGAAADHADHLVPLARGGMHCISNLVPACASCNRRKSDSDPFVWLLSLS